jgi:adenosylcobyric acid synthase
MPFFPKARPIMILGTASHAGKSTVAAALCRLLARRGLKVAPFKAQNMSLNSFVTPEGGEIGRAQALQAKAARVECHTDMNPVLLKPTGEGISQVIVNGHAVGNRTAREYYADKASLRREAFAAYDRLASRFDVIVLEGAGSPAEINLRDEDFVNMAMAEHAGARCLLVADIDRGGVFASILGTVELLEERHRKLFAGIVINKFRGDVSLLTPGLEEITRLTGMPVLGVLPYLPDLRLDEEDSMGLPFGGGSGTGNDGDGTPLLDLAVIRLPHISNFTDFHPLERSPALRVRYVSDPLRLGNPDLLILPGSKSVRSDLGFLRASGLERAVRAAAERHTPVLGLCGGYQMLGLSVRDPEGIESAAGESEGLGLLPVVTVMEKEKELCRVEARNLALPFLAAGHQLAGYEIHMGKTAPQDDVRPAVEITRRQQLPCGIPAGAVAATLPVFGLYVHGLFEEEATRNQLVTWLLARKGLDAPSTSAPGENLETALDRIADALAKHLDLKPFFP